MGYIAELIEQYGIVIVFINVLLEQLGLPIPAYPTLVLAGALVSPAKFPSRCCWRPLWLPH
jgi:membrane protein DedA with SNARE-associated domain